MWIFIRILSALLVLLVAFPLEAQRAVPAAELLALIESDRLERAEAILRQNLAHADKHPSIDYLLGLVLSRSWKPSQAIPHLERATSRVPDRPVWLHALATALAMDGQCARAIEVLDRAIAQAPSAGMAFDRARCLLEGGQLAAAADALASVVASDPEHIGALLLLVKTQIQLGHDEQALQQLREPLEHQSALPEAQLLLGRLLERSGDVEAAEVAYREVLRLVPGHASAGYALGQSLMRRGQREEARQWLQAFARNAPRREQIENLRQYLLMHPEDDARRLKLAEWMLADGDASEARAELRLVLRRRPDTVQAWSLMARAQHALGERLEAERSLRRAAALSGGVPP